MKIESSSNLKAWRVCETRKKIESSQDLYLACVSFLVLLFVAVADAAFKI
jgi:hypothetical protein